MADKICLIFRHPHRSMDVVKALEQCDISAVSMPLFDIQALDPDDMVTYHQRTHKDQARDIDVFLSVYGIDMAKTCGIELTHRHCLAIGPKSAERLKLYWPKAIIHQPIDSNSHGIIQWLKHHPWYQKILIHTGQEPNRRLFDALDTMPHYNYIHAMSYRRVYRPINTLIASLISYSPDIAEMVIYNLGSLKYLSQLIANSPDLRSLRHKPMIMISDLMAEHARDLGFTNLTCLDTTDTTTIVASVVMHHRAI